MYTEADRTVLHLLLNYWVKYWLCPVCWPSNWL